MSACDLPCAFGNEITHKCTPFLSAFLERMQPADMDDGDFAGME